MKTPSSLFVVSLIATSTLFAQSPAPAPASTTGKPLTVSGWTVIGDKTNTFGPKEESGTITFAGPGFGDKGKNEAAFFPKTELAPGDSLEFRSKVTFTGVAGIGNFRFGIYQKRSKDHCRGWMGYTAFAGIEKKYPKGGLFTPDPNSESSYDSATPNAIGQSIVTLKNIKDGTYILTIKVTRTAAAIECTSTMAPDTEPEAYVVEYSATDASPLTTSFDAIGFSTHQVLSADSIAFSDVSLKLLHF